jgi:hypothetical protein
MERNAQLDDMSDFDADDAKELLRSRFIKQNQRLINCGHVLNKLNMFKDE